MTVPSTAADDASGAAARARLTIRGLAAADAWAGLAGYIHDCVAFGTGALC